jgi:hypothetical protein
MSFAPHIRIDHASKASAQALTVQISPSAVEYLVEFLLHQYSSHALSMDEQNGQIICWLLARVSELKNERPANAQILERNLKRTALRSHDSFFIIQGAVMDAGDAQFIDRLSK